MSRPTRAPCGRARAAARAAPVRGGGNATVCSVAPGCPGDNSGRAALSAAEGQADGPLGAGWPRLAGPAHRAAARLQKGMNTVSEL